MHLYQFRKAMWGKETQVTLLLVCLSLVVIPSSATLKHSDEETEFSEEPQIDFEHPELDISAAYFVRKIKSPIKIKTRTKFTGPDCPFITDNNQCGVCGGVIDASSDVSQAIDYKYNENYTENELCIWTIRNTDGASFVFYKYPTQFGPTDTFLQISTFEKDRYFEPSNTVILGTRGHAASSSQEVILKGPVAFVIFSTLFMPIPSYAKGKGFRLLVYTTGNPSYDYTYSDLSSRSKTGSLNLPSYSHNMMSTFVVSPKIRSNVLLRFETESYSDHVSVFKLERGYEDFAGKMIFGFYGRNSGYHMETFRLMDFNNHTALLFIFTSDDSGLGIGPQIMWESVDDDTFISQTMLSTMSKYDTQQ